MLVSARRRLGDIGLLYSLSAVSDFDFLSVQCLVRNDVLTNVASRE